MISRRTLAALSILALACALPPALRLAAAEDSTAQAAEIDRGHAVFDRWCAPCHAPGPLHPGTQALAVKYKGTPPAPLEQRTDLTPAVVRFYVRNGVYIMPPFRKTEITDSELEALGAYLSRKH